MKKSTDGSLATRFWLIQILLPEGKASQQMSTLRLMAELAFVTRPVRPLTQAVDEVIKDILNLMSDLKLIAHEKTPSSTEKRNIRTGRLDNCYFRRFQICRRLGHSILGAISRR